jgi:hypothetical protein
VYNTYEPNVTSIFSAELSSSDIFVWLLWPSEKKAAGNIIRATLLSKQDNSVTVRINEPGKGEWVIRIPFLDKNDIAFSFKKK